MRSLWFYNKVLFIFIIHMSGLSLAPFTSDCNTDLSFLQETEQTPATPSLGTFSGGKSILDYSNMLFFFPHANAFV